MFTLGTKTFFVGALVAQFSSVGYAANSSDQAGVVVLVGASLALVAVGLGIVFGAGSGDRFSFSGQHDLRPARGPGHTPTPFLAAVSAGLFVIGFAMGAPFLVVGAIALAICVSVWFSEVWRDHPDYVETLTNRVSGYISLPFGMPLMLVSVIGFVAISVSRTLLAVNHTAAWIIAAIVAAAVFVSAIVLAMRPTISKRTMTAFVVLGAAVILGMGVYGQVQGKYKGHEGVEHGEKAGEAHSSGEEDAGAEGQTTADDAEASAEETS